MIRLRLFAAAGIAGLLVLSSSCHRTREAVVLLSKPIDIIITCNNGGTQIGVSDPKPYVGKSEIVKWKVPAAVDATIVANKGAFPYDLKPAVAIGNNGKPAEAHPANPGPDSGATYHYAITATCPGNTPGVLDPDLIIV
jgi:hypothetical protein